MPNFPLICDAIHSRHRWERIGETRTKAISYPLLSGSWADDERASITLPSVFTPQLSRRVAARTCARMTTCKLGCCSSLGL